MTTSWRIVLSNIHGNRKNLISINGHNFSKYVKRLDISNSSVAVYLPLDFDAAEVDEILYVEETEFDFVIQHPEVRLSGMCALFEYQPLQGIVRDLATEDDPLRITLPAVYDLTRVDL